MSCPQIWNIEQEKDREKEKVGGRQAKINEKKATEVNLVPRAFPLKNGLGTRLDRGLGREIKNKKGGIFLLEEQQENFVAAVTK